MTNYSYIVYLNETDYVIKGTLKECSKCVQEYIAENNLGSSQFYGGLVLHPTEGKYADISYNGRIWHYSEDWRDRREFTEHEANQYPTITLEKLTT